MVGNVAMLTSVGTIAMPCSAKVSIESSCSPVACSMQSMPAAARSRSDSSPKQCAVTRTPSSCAAAMAAATASRDQLGARSPSVAVDPVADELDPAVTVVRLEPDVPDELVLLDLVGEVADVAAGAGDVPTGADHLGQVVAVVDPPGVTGLAGVADEEGPGVAVGERLLLGLLGRHLAVRPEPDVAVGVDEAGQGPPLDGLHVGAGGPGAVNETRPSMTHRSGTDFVRPDEDLPADMKHRCRHVPTLPSALPAGRLPRPSATARAD